jgi:uncharacterized protein YdeI (BOF family)
MNTLVLAIGTVLALGAGTGIVGAVESMADKEAKPTFGERFTKSTVQGTLMKRDGEYYLIKDNAGKEITVHVDASTKLDKVVPGDRVKAYVTENGHTTTLQRDE